MQQSKAITQVQLPAQVGVASTQILTPSNIQVQQQALQAGTSGTTGPVATLVKTAGTVTGVRTASPQLRHLQLHSQMISPRKISGQKVTQLGPVAGKTGVQTQLILQQKGGLQNAMTMQQFQQVMKQVQPAGSVQQFAHVSCFSHFLLIP